MRNTYGYTKSNELSGYCIAHHGIKGQKWGIRRYQNEDGSLTAEGMRRYGVYSNNKQIANKFDSMTSQLSKNRTLLKDKSLKDKSFMDEYKKVGNDWENELKKYKDKDYRKSMKAGKKMEKAGVYSKQQKNTFLNKISENGAEDNPHVHKKGIGSSYDTKVDWQKLPINLTFFDSNSNNKNSNEKASNFYDKATDKKFLDKLISSSPDGKKDLSKLIDYYRVTYASDNGKDELIVEANIDSNGPAPVEYIFDGKTLKFKETNWV